MKTLWIDQKMKYDGSQLRPLYTYEKHGLLGNSMIAWVGPCDVTLEHMVDYEDKIQNAKIAGDEMLHFIVEIFDSSLLAAVALQRLLAAIVKDEVYTLKNSTITDLDLYRSGDDVYCRQKDGSRGKLSISIASRSAVSLMIHFAVNVVNEGAPVKTSALKDFGIQPQEFVKRVFKTFSDEVTSILEATQKVKPLG